MESTNQPEKKKAKDGTNRGITAHRQTDYIPEVHDDMVNNFGLLGYSATEIAGALMISDTAFKRWIKTYPSFRASLYAGREIADSKVAAAFYKSIVGYTLEQEKAFVDKDGCEHVIKITEEVGPNSGAALNWLKNRQPNLWSDKQQIEHSGEMSVTMDLNGGDAGSGEVINIDHEEIEEDSDDE